MRFIIIAFSALYPVAWLILAYLKLATYPMALVACLFSGLALLVIAFVDRQFELADAK